MEISPELLWNAFHSLRDSKVIKDTFATYGIPLTSGDVRGVLLSLGEELNFDLLPAEEWFQSEIDQFDDSYLVDLNRISEKSLVRRLENYVLYLIYYSEDSEQTLKEFIKQARLRSKTLEESKELPSNSQLTQDSSPAANQKKPIQTIAHKANEGPKQANDQPIEASSHGVTEAHPRTNEEHTEIRINEPIEGSSHGVTKLTQEPKKLVKTKPVHKKEAKPELPLRGTWLSKHMKRHPEKLQEIFKTHSNNELLLPVSLLPNLLQDFFSFTELEVQNFQMFQKAVNARYDSETKVNFAQFIDVAEEWAQTHGSILETVNFKIKETIEEYQTYSKEFSNYEQILGLNQLVSEMKLCLEKAKQIPVEKPEFTDDATKQVLLEIFSHYTKPDTRKPTFEDLNQANTSLNLGKFLKFCNDFQIMGKTNEIQRFLNKETLINIFKTTSNNTRLMSFPQFLECLDKVSKLYYNSDYDQINSTNFSEEPIRVKREKLLTRIKKLNSSFRKVQKRSQPNGFLKTPNYKIVSSADSLEQGDKRTKKTSVSENTRKRRVNSTNRNTKLQSLVPLPGYASRNLVKKDVTRKNSYATKKSHNYFEATPKESTEISRKYSNKTPVNQLEDTYKSNDMPYVEYKNQDTTYKDLEGLITEGSDEMLERFYGKIDTSHDGKLEGVMRMHDNMIQRGHLAIERTKKLQSRFLYQ